MGASEDAIVASVIMPAYNHESYIRQAIESIIHQQTNFKFELLVGDDCSQDSTSEIIKDYCKKYPGIVRGALHKKNMGATKNGYSLIKNARGKYLAFCDGDDFWTDSGRLQRDVDFLNKNKAYIGICSRTQAVNEDGTSYEDGEIRQEQEFWKFGKDIYTLEDFQKWEMPGHISTLTLRNFFKEIKQDYSIFYKAHPMVGDRTIVLLSALNGKIFCGNEYVSCYRYRTNSNNNFMSEFKSRNLRAEDFLMIRRLERYAQREFGETVDLDVVKKDRLIGSVVIWLKNPDRENMQVVRKIIRYSGMPLLYAFYVLKIICRKWFDWYVKKIDRRISL